MGNLRNTIRRKLTTIAKNNIPLRKLIRFSLNTFRKANYRLQTLGIKTDEKTVAFNSFNGKNYSCTPKAVYEYMLSSEKFKDYKFIWVVRDLEKYAFLAENPNTTIVKDKSKVFKKALAKAKYWIFNYRIYDHITPKKNQIYVQCWHGTPLKRLGYDIENSNNALNSIEEIKYKYRTDAKRFKYILSPSKFASEKFSSAWNLENTNQTHKVLEVGYPRDDFMSLYSKEDVKRIKADLGISEDKKILLYAPTWRDNQHTSGVGYTYSTELDFKALKDTLGDDWVVLFRAHYLVANSFDFAEHEGFVYDVCSYSDINELYVVSDALVTDYSSVFFDYSILKRPMLFYMYDLVLYKDNMRGFYIDLNELPGPIVERQEDLFEKLKTIDEWFSFDEKYKEFDKKYNYLNDGKATERFVEAVFKE